MSSRRGRCPLRFADPRDICSRKFDSGCSLTRRAWERVNALSCPLLYPIVPARFGCRKSSGDGSKNGFPAPIKEPENETKTLRIIDLQCKRRAGRTMCARRSRRRRRGRRSRLRRPSTATRPTGNGKTGSRRRASPKTPRRRPASRTATAPGEKHGARPMSRQAARRSPPASMPRERNRNRQALPNPNMGCAASAAS